MVNKRGLSWAVALLGLVCLALLARESYRYYQASRYNAAIAQQDWATATRYAGVYGRFAAAYALQQQGDWQRALEAYSGLATAAAGDTDLLAAIHFNSANAYLQGALKADLESADDLTIPLVELAKTSYRDLLQQQPRHWDAKYNLERALQLFPDVEQQSSGDWQAPEHGPRALISIEAEQPLP